MARNYEPLGVSLRVKLAAMWTTLLFVFAYVDIFSFFRPDVRADIAAGEVGGFAIGEGFLLGTTIYILIPSLMVLGSVLLRPAVNRLANIVLAVVYAFTIAIGAVGEWGYYILGSVVEVGILAAIVFSAWNWPTATAKSTDLSGELPVRELVG